MRLWFMYIDGNVINDHARFTMFSNIVVFLLLRILSSRLVESVYMGFC